VSRTSGSASHPGSAPMFQYHGTASVAPLREELPSVGNSKPVCRSLLSGKEIHGRYRIGTPLNTTRVLWPMPRFVCVLSVRRRARSSQSAWPFGQVVLRDVIEDDDNRVASSRCGSLRRAPNP